MVHILGLGIAIGTLIGHLLTKHWPTLSKLVNRQLEISDEAESSDAD